MSNGNFLSKCAIFVCAGFASLCTPSAFLAQELDLIQATELTARAILERAGRATEEKLPQILFGFAGTTVFGGCIDEKGDAAKIPGSMFCAYTNTIVLEPNQLEGLRRQFGDGAVAYAIAHEVGHWVQATFGDPQFDAIGAKRELQADCIAGILLYGVSKEIGFTAQDAREAINAAYSIGSKSHGAPYERAYALKSGFSGDPDECYPTNQSRSRSEKPEKPAKRRPIPQRSDPQPTSKTASTKESSAKQPYQPRAGTNSVHPSAARTFYMSVDTRRWKLKYKGNGVWNLNLYDVKVSSNYRQVPIDLTVDCALSRNERKAYLGISLNGDPWDWYRKDFYVKKFRGEHKNPINYFMFYAFLEYACDGKVSRLVVPWQLSIR